MPAQADTSDRGIHCDALAAACRAKPGWCRCRLCNGLRLGGRNDEIIVSTRHRGLRLGGRDDEGNQ
jgi:hypothetical protein